MKIRYVIILQVILLAKFSLAQDSTRYLREVRIQGEKWLSEYPEYQLNLSDSLIDNTQIDLAESARELYGVNIIQNGVSGLSSPRLRGTRPEHTAILWNGININHAGLGQTNLFLYPGNSFNQAYLELGTSSALYGNSSIGGSIILQDNIEFRSENNLAISYSYGSFDRHHRSVDYQISNEKWYGSINLYDNRVENDFEYVNTLDFRRPTLKQVNADYRQSGAKVNLGHRIDKNNRLILNSWIHDANTGIQPNMNVTESNDHQKDFQQRHKIEYTNFSQLGISTISLFYTEDRIDFNSSISNVKRYGFRYALDKRVNKFYTLKAGVNYDYFLPAYEFLEQDIYESRYSGFLLNKLHFQKFEGHLKLRYNYVEGYNSPLVPSALFRYKIREKEQSTIYFDFSIAKGFKLPTLNERYWIPGGNQNISPEESEQIELAFISNQKFWNLTIKAYDIRLKNAVQWLQVDSSWSEITNRWYYNAYSPLNVNRIESRGLNVFLGHEYLDLSILKIRNSIAYNQNISINQETGERSPYAPENSLSYNLFLKISQCTSRLNYQWLDKRWFQSNELEPYSILNADLMYSYNFGRYDLETTFSVKNIGNTRYQSIINRAMPGRHYLITLKLNLNFNENS